MTVECEAVDASSDVRPDVDGDGARKPGDCDDASPAIRPGAAEVPENGVDEDCDGADAVVLDRDGDGVPRPLDCDDTRADVRPGSRERFGNRIDENCDGRAEPFPTLGAKLAWRVDAFPTYTVVTRLRLTGLRRGEHVARSAATPAAARSSAAGTRPRSAAASWTSAAGSPDASCGASALDTG